VREQVIAITDTPDGQSPPCADETNGHPVGSPYRHCRPSHSRNALTQAAASFSFLSARALMRTVAGFASNQRSWPVNGSLPKRFFFAGTC